MSILDKIQLIPRERKIDHRGWLLKVINGYESNLPDKTGEFYITLAVPGQTRGNHYHKQTSEWFTVILGCALLVLGDPETGERQEVQLSEDNAVTVYIPAGIGHVFKNPDDAVSPMVLVAYADHLYNPHDTILIDLL